MFQVNLGLSKITIIKYHFRIQGRFDSTGRANCSWHRLCHEISVEKRGVGGITSLLLMYYKDTNTLKAIFQETLQTRHNYTLSKYDALSSKQFMYRDVKVTKWFIVLIQFSCFRQSPFRPHTAHMCTTVSNKQVNIAANCFNFIALSGTAVLNQHCNAGKSSELEKPS